MFSGRQVTLSRELTVGLGILLLAGLSVFASRLLPNGPGARSTPSATEAAIARRLRSWTLPRSARVGRNPFKRSPELIRESARHFADHCASCHANDGSGATEIGRHLFPRVPDMRAESTQRLSDGELYYIIHNGIRWTGMPAWGDESDDDESWKLVPFIRHLPYLTQDEIRDMEGFNPKSVAEQDEEKQEDEFLNDGGRMPHQAHKTEKDKSK